MSSKHLACAHSDVSHKNRDVISEHSSSNAKTPETEAARPDEEDLADSCNEKVVLFQQLHGVSRVVFWTGIRLYWRDLRV